MGKGSGRRPTDEDKYQSNWEAIFNNKKQEKDKEDELPKETKDADQ